MNEPILLLPGWSEPRAWRDSQTRRYGERVVSDCVLNRQIIVGELSVYPGSPRFEPQATHTMIQRSGDWQETMERFSRMCLRLFRCNGRNQKRKRALKVPAVIYAPAPAIKTQPPVMNVPVKQSRDYRDFLKDKRREVVATGIEVSDSAINPKLFKFQRDVVRWSLQLGRAALYEECGLGKTAQELEWSKHVAAHTGKPVLNLAPLAVAYQTVQEGKKFDVEALYCADQAAVPDSAPVIVTNYDRLHLFDLSKFGGVVLDESSILKNLGGKVFWQLVRGFETMPFKLCGTATPAPNDYVEFSNHSTFLGLMHFKEVLARWFTGDSKLARSAILKQHGEADFWRWLTSWSVCLSTPGDLGSDYAMPGYDLPPLEIHEHRLNANQKTIDRTWAEGMLIPDSNPNSVTLHRVKRESLADRVVQARAIVDTLSADEPIIIWCDTNYEADALVKAFPDALEIRGDTKDKEARLLEFSAGQARLLITKPEIAGFGLNWQHCATMIFIGVSFSFERTYQALRRSYRYGQTRPVHVHMIYAETEGNVMDILKRKQKDFEVMQAKMTAAVREHGLFRLANAPQLMSAAGHQPITIPNWLRPHTYTYSAGVMN